MSVLSGVNLKIREVNGKNISTAFVGNVLIWFDTNRQLPMEVVFFRYGSWLGFGETFSFIHEILCRISSEYECQSESTKVYVPFILYYVYTFLVQPMKYNCESS